MIAGWYIEGAIQHDGYFLKATVPISEVPEPYSGTLAQGVNKHKGQNSDGYYSNK